MLAKENQRSNQQFFCIKSNITLDDHLWPDALCPRLQRTCDDIPLNSTPSHVMLLSYVNAFKNTSNLSSAAAPLYKTKGQRLKVSAETGLYMMHGTVWRAGSLLCEIWHYASFVIPGFFFIQPPKPKGEEYAVFDCVLRRDADMNQKGHLNTLWIYFRMTSPWNRNLSLYAEVGSIRSDV